MYTFGVAEGYMSNGWDESAAAWIADMGEGGGEFSRWQVLDAPMLARARASGARAALDVGCGEGRFCRMLREAQIATVGIDPTTALIAEARRRDPGGDYREGRAEALDFPDGSFDLVVSYLTLIDIPDFRTGIAEMARVLAPGGALLVANLNGFSSASTDRWVTGADGVQRFSIDNYLDETARWEEWRGIRIVNHHRPLSAYMRAFLGAGLTLTHFDEPEPVDMSHPRAPRYRRVPWHHIMEWRKPC
jgi:SAM-dependent methyltransferase